jgi:8-oxo-dGTP pyrophosphatase MutT (NUDIX family)
MQIPVSRQAQADLAAGFSDKFLRGSMTVGLREYRAAGGVVLDDTGRALLIERWVLRNGQLSFEIRLPKGHVEEGETDEQAALRETCEETGYCGLAVTADLGEYLNEFILPDERVLRHEHFYLMRLTDATPGEPHFDSANADEARFLPRWAANLAEAEALITFASEREFVARARKLETGSSKLEARRQLPVS